MFLLTAITLASSTPTVPEVSSFYAQAKDFASFGSNIVIVVLGVIGAYKVCTGGFGFMKAVKKVTQFVGRVDVLVDDFWPEILSGLEGKGFISTGATARWTSIQAKVLKSQSPIQITPQGDKILSDIGLEQVYLTESSKILGYVKLKLSSKKNITNLDIEQASLEVGSQLFDDGDSLIEGAKKYLFEHPTMPTSQLKVLIGIFIRDKMFLDESIKKIIEESKK